MTSDHTIILIFIRYPKVPCVYIYVYTYITCHVSYIYIITYESIAVLSLHSLHLHLIAALRATSRGHVCPVFPKRPQKTCRSPWHRPGRTPRPPPRQTKQWCSTYRKESGFTNLKHIDHHKSSIPKKKHPFSQNTADLVRTLVNIAWLSSDLSQKILTKFGGYWFFEPNFVKSANVFETVGTFCSLCMTTGKPLHSAKQSLPSCQQNGTTQQFKKDSTSSWLVLNVIGSEHVHLSSWLMSCRHLPLFQTEMEPFRWSISTLMASIPCVSVGAMQVTTNSPHLKFSPGICPVGRAADYQLHSLESHRRSCRVQGPYQPGDFEMIQKSNLLPHPFSTWCDLVVPPSSIPGKK